MDKDHNQLVQYEQNLAACYETEYLLSMKVEDQDFYKYTYDDISEVSTVPVSHFSSHLDPEPRSMCGSEDMDTDDARCHVQAQVEQQYQWVNNVIGKTVTEVVSPTELEEKFRPSTIHNIDEEHFDGPNRKRARFRQPNS